MLKEKDTQKIGIIGWFGEANFGSNLQSLALYKTIRGLGKECELVKMCFDANKADSFRNSLFLVWRRLRNRLKGCRFGECSNFQREKNVEKTFVEDTEFYLVDSHQKYKKLSARYDCFVVGSDQLWNPHYINHPYVLSFVEDARKVSYATSLGVRTLPEEKLPYYRHISDFDFVSVRESCGARLLEEVTGRTTEVCLDPTFLLSAEQWLAQAEKAEIPEEINAPGEFVLCYLVGANEEYAEAVAEIQKKCGQEKLVLLTASGVDHKALPAVHFESAGPREFLWLASRASFVITDSFHAVVFSLLFEKQFAVLRRFHEGDKSSQNSRLDDLFARLAVSPRYFAPSDDAWRQPIDYQKLKTNLEPLVGASVAFLKKSLGR